MKELRNSYHVSLEVRRFVTIKNYVEDFNNRILEGINEYDELFNKYLK